MNPTEIKDLPRLKVRNVVSFPCGLKDVAIIIDRFEDDDLDDADCDAIIELVGLIRKAKARARATRMAAVPTQDEANTELTDAKRYVQ